MNKHIFKTFSPSASHIILVFPYQTLWQYSDGDLLTGASNAGGVGKKFSIFSQNLAPSRALNGMRPTSAIHSAVADHGKLTTLVAGKRRTLLMAGDDDEVFMTRSLNITPKTTEQSSI